MTDPFFHDDKQMQRMADDREIVARYMRNQWIKAAIGLATLALIAAIWLVWRFG